MKWAELVIYRSESNQKEIEWVQSICRKLRSETSGQSYRKLFGLQKRAAFYKQNGLLLLDMDEIESLHMDFLELIRNIGLNL